MNRISATLAVLATAALATAAPPARAVSVALPAAKGFAECATSAGNIDDASFCQTATDLAQVTQAPFAGAHAEATYPGGFAVAQAGAIAILTYYWTFEGGTPGNMLPVDISVNLGITSFGSNNAFGFASVTVGTIQGNSQVCVYTFDGCAQGSHGFSGTMRVMARSGDVNTIVIEAEASGVFSPDANGGTAFADPHIFLDPAFASAANYQLRISDGVSNDLAPIPEPASAALLAAGMAGLAGVLVRRRRR